MLWLKRSTDDSSPRIQPLRSTAIKRADARIDYQVNREEAIKKMLLVGL